MMNNPITKKQLEEAAKTPENAGANPIFNPTTKPQCPMAAFLFPCKGDRCAWWVNNNCAMAELAKKAGSK
jgi:hypothetical protein